MRPNDKRRRAVTALTLPHLRCGRLLSFALLCAAAVSLSGCKIGILAPIGPIGTADEAILVDSLGIMLAIVIPTMIATLLFAWWFRASNVRARYLPDWEYSGQIEMVVWGIPALVVLLLGGVAWIGSHDLDPAKPIASKLKPLDIQVVSLDWKWLFLYPQQGVATLNQLVLPQGVPVHLSLTSASVMNVFFVPQLGSMIYTMNGMSVQLHLQSDKTGTFEGLSAHFSGDGFPGMRFLVHVVDPADFTQWAKTAAASPTVLDDARYRGLLPQSTNVPPATYKLGDPNLYEAIVTQRLPPGYGPQEGEPSIRPKSAGLTRSADLCFAQRRP